MTVLYAPWGPCYFAELTRLYRPTAPLWQFLPAMTAAQTQIYLLTCCSFTHVHIKPVRAVLSPVVGSNVTVVAVPADAEVPLVAVTVVTVTSVVTLELTVVTSCVVVKFWSEVVVSVDWLPVVGGSVVAVVLAEEYSTHNNKRRHKYYMLFEDMTNLYISHFYLHHPFSSSSPYGCYYKVPTIFW